MDAIDSKSTMETRKRKRCSNSWLWSDSASDVDDDSGDDACLFSRQPNEKSEGDVSKCGGSQNLKMLVALMDGNHDGPDESSARNNVRSSADPPVGRSSAESRPLLEASASSISRPTSSAGREGSLNFLTSNVKDPMIESDDRLVAFCGSQHVFLDCTPKVPATTTTSTSDEMNNSQSAQDDFFGMGEKVKNAFFHSFRIRELHPWQSEMLQRYIIDENCTKNALITAPTSGGKTLVAFIVMLRTMLLDKKDCMLVLPYVAIVSEKVHELRQLANKLPFFNVVEYAGSKGQFPIPRRKTFLRTLFVCTPEKANGIWKFLCSSGKRQEEIGVVAVDECHMLRDENRGAVIEELLVSVFWQSTSSTRILALSATIGNLDTVRDFLGCTVPGKCIVYNATRRPRKLCENIIVSGVAIPILRSATGQGTIDYSNKGADLLDEVIDKWLLEFDGIHTFDERVIAKLVLESMSKGNSVLVFCNTRKLCVSTCEMLTMACRHLASLTDDSGITTITVSEEVKKQRELVVGHLKAESKGMVSSTLLDGVSAGVGYHSAELYPIERQAVEGAFKRNIISVLCCTSTLAAGVNLPASRVIIRSPWNVKTFLSCSQYLQIIGRCGRTNAAVQSDEVACVAAAAADSFILLQPNDVARFQTLVEGSIEPVTSQLSQVSSYYQRGFSAKARHLDENFNGVARIVLNSLSTSSRPLKVSELVSIYKLTLMYQCGEKFVCEGTEKVTYTLEPFLKQLQALIICDQVHLEQTSKDSVMFKLVVKESALHVNPQNDDVSEHVQLAELSQNLKEISTEERETFLCDIKKAIRADSVMIKDFFLRLSAMALASSAGSISPSDAETFVREAENLEKNMSLENTLAFIFLSITENISKPLIEDVQFREDINAANTRLIDRVIARGFADHPDSSTMRKLGISEEFLKEWVVGNPTVRNKKTFNNSLTRMWSSLFLKDWLESPDDFEKVCFDRTFAYELSSTLASRCQNLKTFCQSLSRFWWYPPLGNLMVKKLGRACDDDLRPLLVLRHMTIERAKGLLKMGLNTVVDVAGVFPPTLLTENIQHMSIWMAVEIILDARMRVSNEASLYEAESAERRKLLLQYLR